MKKPYICFCGDKDKCREISEACKGRMKSVFITDKNADRLLVSPESHPVLICLIFSPKVYANDSLFEKIYTYSASTRCPLHIDGSRRNLDTVMRHADGANIQRSGKELMIKTINELYEFASNNPDSEFELLKARFENVAIISGSASSLAFCENKASASEIKPRVIAVSANCEDCELELLKNVPLSQIITDSPLNENSLELFSRVSKSEAPTVLLDCKESYGRKIKTHHVDGKTESNKITELLNEYSRRKSKMLYLKSK